MIASTPLIVLITMAQRLTIPRRSKLLPTTLQKLFPVLLLAVGTNASLGSCSILNSQSGRNPSTNTTQLPVTETKSSVETGRSKTTQEVEKAITRNLSKEIGVPLKSASCPNQQTLTAGQVFECKAKIEQGSFLVKVTVKDPNGQLNFRTKQLLVLSEAEKLLQQSIKKSKGIDIKADCGDKVRLFTKVGDRFDCKLIDPNGKKGTATITVINEEGKVDAKWRM